MKKYHGNYFATTQKDIARFSTYLGTELLNPFWIGYEQKN